MPCCLPASLSFDVGVLAMALYGGQEGITPVISTLGSVEGARAELTQSTEHHPWTGQLASDSRGWSLSRTSEPL